MHDDVVVEILVAWELCWYRFEADLEGEIVHRRAQGYELDRAGTCELTHAERAADQVVGWALAEWLSWRA